MISFEKVREELSRRRRDISYFDEEFYNTYMAEREHAVFNLAKGDSFKETIESDFYNLNSPAYCEFLEVVNSMLTKFRFSYYVNDKAGYVMVRATDGNFLNEDEARAVASQIQSIFGYDYAKAERR